MFKELLFATGNKNKFAELNDLVIQQNIKLLPAYDYNLEEPEETGKTFKENSILKAKYYGIHTGKVSLADDSGLCVEALNGEPGVYSARFGGETRNNESARQKIEQELKKIGTDNYKAHFACNLSLYIPETEKIYSFDGKVDGILTFPSRGESGFGYDPIFIPEGYDKTFAELGFDIKKVLSHRARAFDKFINWIKENEK